MAIRTEGASRYRVSADPVRIGRGPGFGKPFKSCVSHQPHPPRQPPGSADRHPLRRAGPDISCTRTHAVRSAVGTGVVEA